MRVREFLSGQSGIGVTLAIKYLALSVGLLCYYAGEYSFLFYLFSIVFVAAFIRTMEIRSLIFLGLLLSFFAVRILFYAEFLYETVRDLRFFWGFFVFLLFFSSENHVGRPGGVNYAPFFRVMVDLLLILLLVEFLTSNIFVSQWPNRQHDFLSDIEHGVGRAYGFGGNASVTSVLVIVLCSVLFRSNVRDILALGMATSATGALVFVAKLFARAKNPSIVLSVLAGAAVFVSFSKQIADFSGFRALEKISLDYFLHIVGVKMNQIHVVLAGQTSMSELILGQPFELNSLRAGDFQLLDYLVFNGFVGVVLLAIVISLFVNSFNILPISLLLIGSIHYQSAFSIPGQIILAWLLSLKADVGDLNSSGLRQRFGFGAAKLAAHRQVI